MGASRSGGVARGVSRRVLRLHLALTMSAAVVTLAGTPAVFGCDCIGPPGLRTTLAKADGVYAIQLPAEEPVPQLGAGLGDDDVVVEFPVLRVYAGPARTSLPVHVRFGDAAGCGVTLTREEYVIAVVDGEAHMGLCRFTSWSSASSIAQIEAELGRGVPIGATAPMSENTDGRSSAAVGLILLAAATAVAGLVIGRRRFGTR